MGLEVGTLAAIGLGLSAVGTGVSVYGQSQAAKQSAAIGRYNYAMQMQQARQQQQLALFQQNSVSQQAAVMQRQAEISQSLANSESQARMNNAAALRQQAEVQAAVDRENFKSTQRDQDRQRAIQRAAIGKQGTVESGSPLELLADTAGEMQQALNEIHYQSELGRRKTLGEAAMEEFGSKLSKAGAAAQFAAGSAEAGFTRQAAALEGAKAAAALTQGRREARIGLMSSDANAASMRIGAVGSLFSGLGSIGSQWTSWRYQGGGAGGTSIGSIHIYGGGRPIPMQPYGLT